MASALQWFLFGLFVWACCLVMNALESRVSAGNEARKARRPSTDDRVRRPGHWWRSLWVDEEQDSEQQPSQREQAMASEIIDLKDRIATLEAIVTDRKFQWEEELNKGS